MAARYLRFQLPGAAAPGAAQRREAPLLQGLLARADEDVATLDWRADAFRIIAPQTPLPPLAPVAHRAAGGPRRQGWVCLATPVHYLAEMSNVRFTEDGILSLDPAEAATLAHGFNAEWRDSGIDLWASSNRLFCGFDTPLDVATRDPDEVRGRHLEDFLPTGRDGVRLRRLMSEMEMWLFDHAVNRSRQQRAQLPVSALWCWGGGVPLATLPVVAGAAQGGDVLFDAYPPGAGRGADVMVAATTPAGEGWSEVEAGWLVPALADLRRGRIAQLELSAGARRFIVSARWRRRLWRRAKPWWEYFE